MIFLLLMAAPPAHAADPQSYDFAIAPTGNAALDQALNASAQLATLRTVAPAGPFALVARAQGDASRLRTALRSFGYYAGGTEITINDHPVLDPNLPSILAAIPNGTSAHVAVTVDTGPLYHLRRVEISGSIPAAARARLGVKPGDPAIAANVLAGRDALLTALLDDGYALARVAPPVAIETPSARVLDVSYTVSTGPRVDLGPIAINGLVHVRGSFIRRRLLVHPGEPFSPVTIEAARQDLAAIGVFGTVRARAAERLDAEGHVPLAFDVTERPRHAVSVSASYATDLGASVGVTFTHRNLFGNAEQLTLNASLTDLGGTDTSSLGYNLGARLIQPDFPRRDQSLQYDLQAVRESLEAYNRTALIAGVTFSRKIVSSLTGSVGLQAAQEAITQEAARRDYALLGLPLGLKYDTTDGPLSPTKGLRAALTVTPTQSFAGQGATFVLAQLAGSTYINLAAPGRSVLALRGLVGTAQGATTFDLPPDQRFYAGGSYTIRGFKYQSVGPRFPDGTPTGGSAVDAAAIEFRQRIGENFGAAVFVDAGQVSAGPAPFEGNVRIGAGTGIRYYTSIGPIRVDVAVPVNRRHGDDAFELYIGLGESF